MSFFRFLHRFSRGLLVGMLVPMVLVMIPVLFIFSEYESRLETKKDCAVVFGAAVWKGSTPSHALYDRTKTAIELYNNQKVRCLIFSGGPSTYGAHEAEVMKKMAVENGVSIQDISLDLQGVSTLETFKNLPQNTTFVFVSNDFHLARIRMFAWKFGLKDFDTHAARYYRGRYTKELYFIGREIGGLMVYGLFWWKY